MSFFNTRLFRLTNVNKHRAMSILYIAIFWTITDFVIVLLRDNDPLYPTRSLTVRESLIFVVSLIMGYLFVFKLKKILRSYPLWVNFTLKSIILLSAAFVINFAIRPLASVMPGKYAVHGVLKYQACDDATCYPPKQIPVNFLIKVTKSTSEPQGRNPPQSPHVHR